MINFLWLWGMAQSQSSQPGTKQSLSSFFMSSMADLWAAIIHPAVFCVLFVVLAGYIVVSFCMLVVRRSRLRYLRSHVFGVAALAALLLVSQWEKVYWLPTHSLYVLMLKTLVLMGVPLLVLSSNHERKVPESKPAHH